MSASNLQKVNPVIWRTDPQPVPYPAAVATMEARVAAVRAKQLPEMVWLLEHSPLYTAGTSARPDDLIDATRFPVYQTGRGGQYTYHGPGQRIAYVMLDLKQRGADIRCYIHRLEEWIIQVLARLDIKGERRPGRVGIWIDHGSREDKIAAIGVRVRQWVTYHGIAINLNPDLEHFDGIVPCGIKDGRLGVTSIHQLGVNISMAELDRIMRTCFDDVFATPIACPS